jgi:acetamidase/formamidase
LFPWTKEKKGVDHRGAGPVYVRGAEPGDVLEVRIIDVKPRPCANPAYADKAFGSNAAA